MIEIKIRCKKHPKYQMKRPPKALCNACWLLWGLKGCSDYDLLKEVKQ